MLNLNRLYVLYNMYSYYKDFDENTSNLYKDGFMEFYLKVSNGLLLDDNAIKLYSIYAYKITNDQKYLDYFKSINCLTDVSGDVIFLFIKQCLKDSICEELIYIHDAIKNLNQPSLEADIYRYLGYSFYKKNLYDKAIYYTKLAIYLYNDDFYVEKCLSHLLGEIKSALLWDEGYKIYLELFNSKFKEHNIPLFTMHFGIICFESKRYKECIEIMNQLIKSPSSNKDKVEALRFIAKSYEKLDLNSEIKECYEKIILLTDDNIVKISYLHKLIGISKDKVKIDCLKILLKNEPTTNEVLDSIRKEMEKFDEV